MPGAKGKKAIQRRVLPGPPQAPRISARGSPDVAIVSHRCEMNGAPGVRQGSCHVSGAWTRL